MHFTAATHFGHGAIIRLCGRPFQDVATIDRVLVDRWNSAVRPKDDLWHVGDFAVGLDPVASEALFRRLHGRKRLVAGNHDRRSTLKLPWMEPPAQIVVVAGAKRRLVLCHYGLRTWPGWHHGALHLYGHSHDRLPGNRRCLDVGTDNWGFRPLVRRRSG